MSTSEKPGFIERTAGLPGFGDPADIQVRYPGGTEVYSTAREVAQEVMEGVELEVVEPSVKQAQRILDARKELQREGLPEVVALHDGEPMVDDAPRVMSWQEFTERAGRWGE